MMVKTKKTMVPKLRFPGFIGEWEQKRINQIVERISKPVDVEDEELYEQIGIRSHGKGIFYKTQVTGKSLGSKRVFWVQPDVFIVNIVFAWEQAVARTTSNEVGMIASHRFPMFKPLKDVSEVDFILFLFLTKRGKHLLGLASPGGAGRNKTLGQQEFAKLKINVPSYPEQHKISNFLTTIDTRIEQLTQKKELLEEYKKGVMQKIFSQEIRFKDDEGKDFPEWEEKRIKDILKIGSGKDYKHLDEGEIPVYGTGGYMTSVNDFLYDGESVCIGRKGTIDKPLFFSGKFWTVDTLFFTHKFSHTIPKFVFLLFQRINWKKYNEASGVPSLSKRTIEKIMVPLPSLPEQQKIADFLTVIDTKINQINQQLEQMKTFKKGLLQQMFV